MLHAKVDIKGIETQRSVVKEEKRQRVDNQPYASFITEMFKRAFPSHPYNWVPIGSMAHLDAAEEQDYVQFYQDFYVPQNATISIAGDIDVESTKSWINDYFGSIPSGKAINIYRDALSMSNATFKSKYGFSKKKMNLKNIYDTKNKKAKDLITNLSKAPIEIKRTTKDTEKIRGVIVDTVYDNIQLSGLFMAYKIPEQTHADSYALEFMNEVLSGGASSRINKTLVEKKQLANYAASFNYGLEDGGLNIFLALANIDHSLTEVQNEFDEQIRLIKETLISEEEYQAVLNKFENSIVGGNSTVAGIAESLADNYVYFGTAERTNQMLENYRKVTREDILRVANTYLTQDARIILNYLPKKK
jgi:predicted Zn-dependent peptidase